MERISKESFLSLSNIQMWELFKKSEIERDSMQQLHVKMDFSIGKIEKLETEVAVGKTINTALKNECLLLKRKFNRNSQYQRLENIEISGIPDSVQDTNMEKTVLALLKKTDVDLVPNDIVDCHCLPKRKTVIVRFVNRKHAQKA